MRPGRKRRELEGMDLLGDRIKSALAERLAAQHPPDRQAGTSDQAVLDDGLVGIVRAGGIEAAGPGGQPSGQCTLVEAYQSQGGKPGQVAQSQRDLPQSWLEQVIVHILVSCS